MTAHGARRFDELHLRIHNAGPAASRHLNCPRISLNIFYMREKAPQFQQCNKKPPQKDLSDASWAHDSSHTFLQWSTRSRSTLAKSSPLHVSQDYIDCFSAVFIVSHANSTCSTNRFYKQWPGENEKLMYSLLTTHANAIIKPGWIDSHSSTPFSTFKTVRSAVYLIIILTLIAKGIRSRTVWRGISVELSVYGHSHAVICRLPLGAIA